MAVLVEDDRRGKDVVEQAARSMPLRGRGSHGGEGGGSGSGGGSGGGGGGATHYSVFIRVCGFRFTPDAGRTLGRWDAAL